ncbi:peptidase [Kaistia algarum]|uniref:M48 family metalloprotease n=1 Tax=Kaistia algarum TaxID=2083279 RepID=UPI000CE7FC7F|nr:M48 family metalloprotease [Kaistia algarum]MCX5515201.1 M48 family metalloprotease [Kaistia algarum]PPE79919.1 peptidase [Kaistia algarum]
MAARRFRRIAGTGLALVSVVAATLGGAETASAQRGPSIIRDAETETLIQDYIRPIFKVAGIRSTSVELFLVDDPSFNAFVASGQKLVINTGAIIDSKTPNELIGVLAHETGHLAGGHQIQLRQQLETAQRLAMIGGLAGIGAAMAGAAMGSPDAARAGGGIAAGVGEAARRSLLAYQRSEEMAADQSALNYLQKTGQSAKGMMRTFERFIDNTLFSARRANPFLQTHPMPVERLDMITRSAKASPYFNVKDSAALQLRHDMVRAKLAAFTEDAGQVMRRYPPDDVSMPARYARVISAYRNSNSKTALTLLDAMLKDQPKNPYFWELEGQILLESGRGREAIAPLQKAVSLAPKSGLLRIMLGQTLVEAGDPKSIDEAIKNLTVGLQQDPDVGIGYRSLARAYAMRGEIPMADLATAQGEFAEGNYKAAKTHAARAQAAFKRGSPPWIRADDILSFQPPTSK